MSRAWQCAAVEFFVFNYDLQWRISVTALTDAIYQNTPGNSAGYPLGLSWDTGVYGTHTLTPAPAGFTALTGWGVIYPEAGASASPNAATDTVQIEGFTTYVHLTDGSWVKVQDQTQSGIGGAHYLADFSGNASTPWQQQTLSDGSVSVDAPLAGYNDHFWPGTRGTYTLGTVDGVFVVANMKTNDPSANLVAQLGADWWSSATATFLYQNGQFVNNPVVGGGDFVKLTTQWQPVYFSSLSASQLQADPPPPLQGGSTTPTTPTGSTSPTTPTTPVATSSTTTIVAPSVIPDATSPAAAVTPLSTVATTTDPSVFSIMGGTLGAMGLTSPSPYGSSASTTSASTGSWTSQDFAQPGTSATAAPQTDPWWGNQGSAAASQASNSFALLNQYLAGSSGRADGGSIAVAMSGTAWTQSSFLTKPQS